jgi:putative lipoprotein
LAAPYNLASIASKEDPEMAPSFAYLLCVWGALSMCAAFVTGCATVAPPAASVTGTATYRERIALPAGAVFEASIEDVSRADAPSMVIGSSRLESLGQVPIRFSIDYEPARIEPNHRYAVRARIMAGENALFATDRFPCSARAARPMSTCCCAGSA